MKKQISSQKEKKRGSNADNDFKISFIQARMQFLEQLLRT